MTSPFPLVPWPANSTMVNKALLDAKINAPLADLDTRVTRPGFGSIKLGSSTGQATAGGDVITRLGFTSPTIVVAGSGMTAGPAGVGVENAGLYLGTLMIEVLGDTTGTYRRGMIAGSASTTPDLDLPESFGSVAPQSAIAFLSSAGIVSLDGNTVYTLYFRHDATSSITIGRHHLGLTRLA